MLYPIFLKGVIDLAVQGTVTQVKKADGTIYYPTQSSSSTTTKSSTPTAQGTVTNVTKPSTTNYTSTPSYNSSTSSNSSSSTPVIQGTVTEVRRPDGTVYYPQQQNNNGYYSNDEFNSILADMQRQLNQANQFDYSKLSSLYDDRFAALERMLANQQTQYDNLLKKNAYNASQASANANANTGTHIIDVPVNNNPSNGTVDLGYSQGKNQMNEALFRYLNTMWNGGF